MQATHTLQYYIVCEKPENKCRKKGELVSSFDCLRARVCVCVSHWAMLCGDSVHSAACATCVRSPRLQMHSRRCGCGNQHTKTHATATHTHTNIKSVKLKQIVHTFWQQRQPHWKTQSIRPARKHIKLVYIVVRFKKNFNSFVFFLLSLFFVPVAFGWSCMPQTLTHSTQRIGIACRPFNNNNKNTDARARCTIVP